MDKKELLEKLQEFLTTHKDLLINFGVTFVATFLAIWIFSLTTNIRFEPRQPEFRLPPPPPPMPRNFNPGPPPQMPPRPNTTNNRPQLPPPTQNPQRPSFPPSPRP